jgi:hypothetical protein
MSFSNWPCVRERLVASRRSREPAVLAASWSHDPCGLGLGSEAAPRTLITTSMPAKRPCGSGTDEPALPTLDLQEENHGHDPKGKSKEGAAPRFAAANTWRFPSATNGEADAGGSAQTVRSTAARWRGDGLASPRSRSAAMSTKQERRKAMAQALANTRLAGHNPTPQFLADATAVVEGTMTYDQAIRASATRARGRNGPESPRLFKHRASITALLRGGQFRAGCGRMSRSSSIDSG